MESFLEEKKKPRENKMKKKTTVDFQLGGLFTKSIMAFHTVLPIRQGGGKRAQLFRQEQRPHPKDGKVKT